MRSVDEYLRTQEGAEPYAESLRNLAGRPGVRRSGMVLFTEDSAHQWSGPFPGGYVLARVVDRSVVPAARPRTRKGRPAPPPVTVQNSEWELSQGRDPAEAPCATVERPVQLHLCGNDDDSRSQFYATVEEAELDLEILVVAEPVDFDDAVGVLNLVFTN